MPKVCAFIFARGGSKGLPRKNILPIGGLPMLVHGIRIAQQLDNVAGVYVSTDCVEITTIAREAGAEVIIRPAELAGDLAPEWHAWQHAIRVVQETYGNFEYFLSLPPTAPLRNLEDVENCLEALRPDVDIVITMTAARRSPWFNMVTTDKTGAVSLVINKDVICRRQDSPQCFDVATVAYVARPEFILSADKIWDGRVTGVEVPIERGLDIDTSFDFALAKFVMEQLNHDRKFTPLP
jgi:CMP-N-acetylneuraminic acid synthetase